MRVVRVHVYMSVCLFGWLLRIPAHGVYFHYSHKGVRQLIRLESPSVCVSVCMCVFLKSSETDFIHYVNYELAPLCHLSALSLSLSVDCCLH